MEGRCDPRYAILTIGDSFLGEVLMIALRALPLANSFVSCLVVAPNSSSVSVMDVSFLEKDSVKKFANQMNISITEISWQYDCSTSRCEVSHRLVFGVVGSFLFRDGTRKSVLTEVRPINSLVTYPANPTGSLYFALDSQTFPLYN